MRPRKSELPRTLQQIQSAPCPACGPEYTSCRAYTVSRRHEGPSHSLPRGMEYTRLRARSDSETYLTVELPGDAACWSRASLLPKGQEIRQRPYSPTFDNE